jgi:hypothetical protein
MARKVKHAIICLVFVLTCWQGASAQDAATSSAAQSLVYQPGTLALAEGQKVGDSNLNLIMQTDGNLVVYAKGHAVWASNTVGKCPGCVASYQGDGNLVLYDNNKRPVWALNSVGSKGLFIRNTAPQVSVFAVPPRPVEVVTADGKMVCNSDAFSQFADDPDLFVGRVFHYADGQQVVGTASECGQPKRPWEGESLALFRMDWEADRLVLAETIFRAPQQLPSGGQIHSAYDPYLARINGKNWLAFECFGLHSTVNACVAPLLPNHRVDVSRLTVPVLGRWGVDSASVPKFLLFKGRIYLSWIVVAASGITTRGMEVTIDASGRLWGAQSVGRSVATDDSRLTHLLGAPNPQDPTANRTLEVMDVRPVGGNQIEALVAVGGGTCTSPGRHEPGCYRLMKSLASDPLGENAFGHVLPTDTLPINPEEYSRYFLKPDGTRIIMGMFLPGAAFSGKTVPTGFWQFPAE